ncbi:MAG TPA: hypothetical protein VJL29_14785 [Thermoguttaceae bacterium]|nr:hypothetical protein [Thermoguttaceae bacterium]
MNFRHSLSTRRCVLAIAALTAMVLTVATFTPARAEPAADSLKALNTSLNLIPDDAAFYSTMLRNGEQVEAIGKSRAWAKLMELPVVKMAQQAYEAQSAQPGNQAAMLKTAMENPQVHELLALLGDMFSTDVFVWGDADTVDSLQLMQETAAAMRYGPAMLQISGQTHNLSDQELQTALLMAVLAENVDRVKVPGLVFGFKVKDKGRAMMHLGKLEGLVGILLSSQGGPEWAEALKHATVEGRDYLVLTIRGDMIPWDQMPVDKLKEAEFEKGSVDKVLDKIKKESLVIAFGMHDDYLMVSIGSSTEPLARLGKGTGLVDRPEMVPLAKYADRKLIAIDYVSKPFMTAANGNQRQIDDMVDFLEQILPSLELTDEQRAEIQKDAAELSTTLKEKLPEMGAVSQASFLAPQGVESFRYDWSTHPGLDATKPLGLLSHVGGSPLLAAVARTKVSVEDYDLGVKWLKKGYGYFRQFGLPNMSDSEREEFEEFVGKAEPILKKAHETTREKFLAAIDGQIGLVLDAQLTSKQFLNTLPATDEAMPMVEPALVLGVRDKKRMNEALDEYWAVIHEVWDMIGEENPDMQDVALPEPATVEKPFGDMFVFTPPEECPVDKKITPTVGLNDSVCVFSLTQSHNERLLSETPLAAGGVLAKTDRPLGVAVVFDWASLVKAAGPWVNMAVEKAIAREYGPDAPDEQAKAITDQVHTVLELLSVLRCVTSEAYMENGVTVVHTLTELRDVD